MDDAYKQTAKRLRKPPTQRRPPRNAVDCSGNASTEDQHIFDPYSTVDDDRFTSHKLAGQIAFSHNEISGLSDTVCVRQGVPAGCYVWPGALPLEAQLALCNSCWYDYPEPPASTNLTQHYGPLPRLAQAAEKGLHLRQHPSERWSAAPRDGPSAASLLRKLRWSSLGPHYDWTARHSWTCEVEGIEKPVEWIPNVALVNYYGAGDTLGGHRDDAEPDLSRPIVCVSLGLAAIFLMGGETRAEPPTPILVRSGDVVVMHGQSRQCFHGIACVFSEESRHCSQEYRTMKSKMSRSRISISIRSL